MAQPKLWLDDVRPAPDDSWDWARTAEEARDLVAELGCDVASLDHDLGGHELDPSDPNSLYHRGDAEDSGMKFVEWLIDCDSVPNTVFIHSWNPVGVENMRRAIFNARDRGLISNTPTVIAKRYTVPA